MPVSRKSKKNMKKSRAVKKQNKKTRKHIRKMKGGTPDEIRKYLSDNFETIYRDNPFIDNSTNTDTQKNKMIEDVMNAINVNSKYSAGNEGIKNIQDFNNFIIQYQNNDLLYKMFDPAIIDYFKKPIPNQ